MPNEFDKIDLMGDLLMNVGPNAIVAGASNDAVYKLRLAEETISKLNPGKRYKLTMVGNNQISVLSDDAPRSVTTAPAVTETTAETTTLPKPSDE